MKTRYLCRRLCALLLAGVFLSAPWSLRPAGAQEETTGVVEVAEAVRIADDLHLQVLLIRHGYAPGLIDGEMGEMTRQALAAFQQSRVLEATGNLNDETREALLEGHPPEGLTDYVISEEDVSGPFGYTFPDDGTNLDVLPPYREVSPAHALAKTFRTTSVYLRQLNPDARFEAGETIRVPNIGPAMWRPEVGS